VEVSFQVDKLVEIDDSVRMELINLQDRALPSGRSKKMPIKIAVPQSLLNFYDADSVTAVIDVGNFTRGTQKALPGLKGLPPYTQIVKLDSVVVKL
jgi:hypothetical protein